MENGIAKNTQSYYGILGEMILGEVDTIPIKTQQKNPEENNRSADLASTPERSNLEVKAIALNNKITICTEVK